MLRCGFPGVQQHSDGMDYFSDHELGSPPRNGEQLLRLSKAEFGMAHLAAPSLKCAMTMATRLGLTPVCSVTLYKGLSQRFLGRLTTTKYPITMRPSTLLNFVMRPLLALNRSDGMSIHTPAAAPQVQWQYRGNE
jgi:hypothetical protein